MTSNMLFDTVAASNFIIMEAHLIAEFAKEWECINNGMEYWNGGMEVQYHFLHPNKYNSSPMKSAHLAYFSSSQHLYDL